MVDVRRERVVKEVEAKNEKMALSWFERNYDKVFHNAHVDPDKVPKKAAKLHEEISLSKKRMVEIQKKEEAEDKLEREVKERIKRMPKYTQDLLDRGPMYPVPEETRKLIYSGVSHNDEGRRAYMNARNKFRPETKYYDPQSFAMDYGWLVEKRCWRPMKEFVRVQVVERSFYRRRGALEADDPNYRPAFSAAHKSVEIL